MVYPPEKLFSPLAEGGFVETKPKVIPSSQVLLQLSERFSEELVTPVSFDWVVTALQTEVPRTNVSKFVGELMLEPWNNRLLPDSLFSRLNFSDKHWVIVKPEVSGLMTLFMGYDQAQDMVGGLQAATGTIRIDRLVTDAGIVRVRGFGIAGMYQNQDETNVIPLGISYQTGSAMGISDMLIGFPEEDLARLVTEEVQKLIEEDMRSAPTLSLRQNDSLEARLSSLGLSLPTKYKNIPDDMRYAGVITSAMLPNDKPCKSLRFCDSTMGVEDDALPRLFELIYYDRLNILKLVTESIKALMSGSGIPGKLTTESLLGITVDRNIPGRITISIPCIDIQVNVPTNYWGVFDAFKNVDMNNPLAP